MVDDKCKEIYGNDEIVKESEKLPNKIKSSLDKGKLIDNEWNDNNNCKCLIIFQLLLNLKTFYKNLFMNNNFVKFYIAFKLFFI